jgi:hypothetical protein
MKVESEKINIRDVADEWRDRWCYGNGAWESDSHETKWRRLAALPGGATKRQVDDVIGNSSWTDVHHCNECGSGHPRIVVRLGEEPDYDSSTAHVCIDCIRKALAAAEKAEMEER